ncbi:hypothetical protein MRB53_014149 [Persea americana]|uniref:Uncharacterized protein n=1 Tax=Persea americana TaxID=3435 RepID=A0ACC2KA00_PERAE|nr:hypothetical protein MRB53_014149 [Persea americana]
MGSRLRTRVTPSSNAEHTPLQVVSTVNSHLSTHPLRSGHPSPLQAVSTISLTYHDGLLGRGKLNQTPLEHCNLRVCNLLFRLLPLQPFASSLLGQTSQVKDLWKGMEIYQLVDEKGFGNKTVVRNSLVDANAKCGVTIQYACDW